MWTSNHDTLLCREILIEEPFKFRLGTMERGQCWDKIASNLNRIGNPRFWVDQRAVRDRFLKLERGLTRTRRDGEMLAMMQQHFREQQEWQKQTQEQNKIMLEFMRKLLDKFI